ncbi:hypothetical protein ACHAXA_001768 [Cyclostephanos tholiformis]|uniref:ACB domain-containing protein n=1 Tax=Cyclostephanos tholiformis TaxID=382380 RepID=A0ABD3RYG0_9STRA
MTSSLQHQRRERMWMAAAGALAIAALGMIWSRRHYRGGRSSSRGRGGGRVWGDLTRGHVLDGDDGHDEPDEELRQVFDEAARLARSIPDGTINRRDQLMLYGLYKQAVEGDRNEDGAPSNLNVVAYAKYDAWGKFKGFPKQFAMRKYCEVVYHFCNGGESAYGNGADDSDADVVYDDANQDDLDEDGCPVDDSGGIDSSGGIVTCMGLRPSTLSGNPEGRDWVGGCRNDGTAFAGPEVRLRNAAASNDVDALRAVMVACDVDDADEDGQTALHYASDRGSIDCLRILVKAGANVNAVDRDGIGVLQTALCAGLDVESVQLLLEAGADPDACDDDGDSPRAWVLQEGMPAMVELFSGY